MQDEWLYKYTCLKLSKPPEIPKNVIDAFAPRNETKLEMKLSILNDQIHNINYQDKILTNPTQKSTRSSKTCVLISK